jgi:hypothetical protein
LSRVGDELRWFELQAQRARVMRESRAIRFTGGMSLSV